MHWGICEMGPYRGPFYKYGLIAEIKACMSSYVDFLSGIQLLIHALTTGAF